MHKWLMVALAAVTLAPAAEAADKVETRVPLHWQAAGADGPPSMRPPSMRVAKVPHATVGSWREGASVFVGVEYADGTKCFATDDEGVTVSCGRHANLYTLGCGLSSQGLVCVLKWTSPEGRAVGDK